MKEIEWKDEYNIGVDVVDKAHRRLFSVVHRITGLLDQNLDDRTRFACQEGIKFFNDYAVKHFAEEEAYMRSIAYSAYEKHKAMHDRLKEETLPVMENELDATDYSIESVQKFLGICIGWLTVHILLEDRAITGRIKRDNIQIGIGEDQEEITAFEESIINMVQIVFGIDKFVRGRYYNGWDFNNPICYESNYNMANGRRSKVAIIIERQLAGVLVGKMMGVSLESADELVLYAVKEMIYVFMSRFEEDMNYSECESAGIECLEEEVFLQMYNTNKPEYSLLFNTRGGNLLFAFYMD